MLRAAPLRQTSHLSPSEPYGRLPARRSKLKHLLPGMKCGDPELDRPRALQKLPLPPAVHVFHPARTTQRYRSVPARSVRSHVNSPFSGVRPKCPYVAVGR